MFIILLPATFLVALLTSWVAVLFFRKPIQGILEKIIDDPIAAAWHRFLVFAIFVVGVSAGVKIWKIERYIKPKGDKPPDPLNVNAWILEIYRSFIETLQGIAWALLAFFVIALLAYAVLRAVAIWTEKRKVE
ncbi:MAG: hypothetical protein JSV08_00150 [Acidobacteriota bacterium]|nr:MAG: hypothetical protein JSV08_00150 [Acidobacteriota bacterium]